MQATLGGMGVASSCPGEFCTAWTPCRWCTGCTDPVERLHGTLSPLGVLSHARASAVLPLPLPQLLQLLIPLELGPGLLQRWFCRRLPASRG